MRALLISIFILTAVVMISAFRNSAKKRNTMNIKSTPKEFYSLSYTSIDDKEILMSDYKGKYVLCVNVASKCGYTPQYEALEKLYETHKEKLVIVGFPCNQFLGQEPGTEKEIQEFCSVNYGVTFPLSSKINVKGKDQHPIYTWLTSKELNEKEDNTVGWNFNKFLISPNGEWLAYFPSKVEPLSGEIEALLK